MAAPPPPTSTRVEYEVKGLDCAEEVSALRHALDELPGVESLDFDLLRGRMVVRFDAVRVEESALRDAVARTGMRAVPWSRQAGRSETRVLDLRVLTTVASGLAVATGFVLHAVRGGGLLQALSGRPPPGAVVAYALAVAAALWFVLPRAWFALRGLRPDMNLLMTVAVAGAIGLGEWFEAGSVSFLFALSLLLEAASVGRARRAVEALLRVSPDQATLLPEDGAEQRVAADAVPVGARVLVRPGERVPLDGRVLAGCSDVDQAPITGESVPVAKQPGDPVFAGTINGDGALEVRTTRPAGETTLARIVAQVEEAQSRRSPSERWVERFARVYTPAVMVLALLTWLVPVLAFGADGTRWLYNALVLLVIACPCALVISTPVSVVTALAAAARRGVLVKGGEFLETAARLRCLALDKTGTVTRGRPGVNAVMPLDDHTDADLLGVAAAIEARSEHPVAAAIVERARADGLVVPAARAVEALPGRGARGEVDGRLFWIGSHRYLEQRGQETPAVHATLEALEADGHTVVVLGNDDHVCGLITLLDAPREEAAEALAALRAQGLDHLVLLTGDNGGTARAIAARLGLAEAQAELLPEDKVAAVERLLERHGAVAMVGDGVNDAPALARSGLGIAMGAAGTDVAIETADVVILSDDLRRLPWLVGHARRTLAVIRVNVVASLGIKAVFIALALAGWTTLWGAIAADMGVSLAVVANALRLLREPRGAPGQGAAAALR